MIYPRVVICCICMGCSLNDGLYRCTFLEMATPVRAVNSHGHLQQGGFQHCLPVSEKTTHYCSNPRYDWKTNLFDNLLWVWRGHAVTIWPGMLTILHVTSRFVGQFTLNVLRCSCGTPTIDSSATYFFHNVGQHYITTLIIYRQLAPVGARWRGFGRIIANITVRACRWRCTLLLLLGLIDQQPSQKARQCNYPWERPECRFLFVFE